VPVKSRPSSGRRAPPRSLEDTLEAVAQQMRTTPDVLRSAARGRAVSRTRATVARMLVRDLGFRVSDVAGALRRDVSTVSSMMSRLRARGEAEDHHLGVAAKPGSGEPAPEPRPAGSRETGPGSQTARPDPDSKA
jgi:hypothetical protein